jgi:Xaa-Pro aminopeptidase
VTAKALLDRTIDSSTRLVPISDNLIDKVRVLPPHPTNILKHHPIAFSGETTLSKLARIRTVIGEGFVSGRDWAYVLPALPAIAWLLNVRCEGDVPFCPVTFAYVVLTRDKCFVFVDEEKVTDEELKKDWDEAGVEVRKYGLDEVRKVIKGLKENNETDVKKGDIKLWTSASGSWALQKVCDGVSPGARL